MPTTYTHYTYGQEIFRMLSPKLQKKIRPYMNYYNIGVHGPDILFYYRSFSKNAVNQYGVKVHDEPMRCFLEHAFSVFKKQRRKNAAFAYLAGFMTHYILDSTCHPYIRRRMVETGISHAEMETDWDYLMMKRDYRNPLHYKVARHIHTGLAYASVIGPYYDISPWKISAGLWYMKLVLNHIFHSHFGVKRAVSAFLNEMFLPKLSFQHYFRKKKMNPQNRETCRQLYRLYKWSRTECVEAIEEMYQALQKDDRSFCEKGRFERLFS